MFLNTVLQALVDECLLGRPMDAKLQPGKWNDMDVADRLLVIECAAKQGLDRVMLHGKLERIAKTGDAAPSLPLFVSHSDSV